MKAKMPASQPTLMSRFSYPAPQEETCGLALGLMLIFKRELHTRVVLRQGWSFRELVQEVAKPKCSDTEKRCEVPPTNMQPRAVEGRHHKPIYMKHVQHENDGGNNRQRQHVLFNAPE